MRIILQVACFAVSTNALFFPRPPECAGGCIEPYGESRQPRATCPVGVLHQVVTEAEADFMVAQAEAYAAKHGWKTERHQHYPTTDLPWRLLPTVWPLLNRTLAAVEADVHARCNLTAAEQLSVNDIFLVKYTARDGQRGLARHRDGSFTSFNLMLSNPTDYEGGGTRFDSCGPQKCAPLAPGMPDDRPLYRVPKGSMLVHGGGNFHEGVPVTAGSRYIVAGFLGLNRHCCSLKYAGVYGLWQLLRALATSRYPGYRAPGHDTILLNEFTSLLGGMLRLMVLLALAYVCIVAAMGVGLWAWERARTWVQKSA